MSDTELLELVNIVRKELMRRMVEGDFALDTESHHAYWLAIRKLNKVKTLLKSDG